MSKKRASSKKSRTPGKVATQSDAQRSDAQRDDAQRSDAQRILAAVKRIPKGRVSTYGNIADVAGLPRRARLVGTVLRQTPASPRLPWFRVINASGKISFPNGSDAYERQRTHLEAEGISFIRGRVDLKRHGWPSRDTELDELLWKLG